jgi:hypothetical protein
MLGKGRFGEACFSVNSFSWLDSKYMTSVILLSFFTFTEKTAYTAFNKFELSYPEK